MPVDPSEPVVTTLVCLFLSHTRLRVQRRPAFPAPSEFGRRDVLEKNSRGCAARSRSCVRETTLFENRICGLARHCHSGMRHLAQARNPYSRSWLWIPGSLVSLAPRNDEVFGNLAPMSFITGAGL